VMTPVSAHEILVRLSSHGATVITEGTDM